MKLWHNRFALIPVMCSECHRYIWLERYRSEWILIGMAGIGFVREDLCSDCAKTYLGLRPRLQPIATDCDQNNREGG